MEHFIEFRLIPAFVVVISLLNLRRAWRRRHGIADPPRRDEMIRLKL